MTLLAKILRWLVARLGWFLVIVATLALGNFLRVEYRSMATQVASIDDYRAARTQLQAFTKNQVVKVTTESRELQAAAEQRLREKLGEIDRETAFLLEQTESPLATVLANGIDAPRAVMKAHVRLAILKQERTFVQALLDQLAKLKQINEAKEERERRRKDHVAVYNELQAAKRRLLAKHDVLALAPFGDVGGWLCHRDDPCTGLYERNQAARRAYDDQDVRVKALERASPAPDPVIRIDRAPLLKVLDTLDADIKRRELLRDNHWAGKWIKPVSDVIPTALVILAALILAPLLIRSFLYFVVAPLAARRPPVRLLTPSPEAEAALTAATSGHVEPIAVSAVSKSVTVDQDHELVIHPEYLQSFATKGDKRTKWLMNWRYPISSLAAGMYALTRVRSASSEAVVVSDASDPLGEIGVIELPAGVALVFQPHNLAGVLQERARPARITRHWRLGSLTAWLTLQLRFLVFHGPATLVVKGCRGIRIEPAGRGRSIDQCATIGYCANLDYSVSRCETFFPYLTGKKGLFNDSFAGGPGYYAYEETPHRGKRAGITGRGLEGFTDAVLKLFGI